MTPAQTLLIAAGLEILFAAFVFVLACRDRINKKWLWLLIILFFAGFTHSVAMIDGVENIETMLSVSTFNNYTSYIVRSTGETQMRIMFPVGAIVFLCLRGKLKAKAASKVKTDAAQEESAYVYSSIENQDGQNENMR